MNSAVKYHFEIPLKYILPLLVLLLISCSSIYSGKPNIGNNPELDTDIPQFSFSSSSNIFENEKTQALVYIKIFNHSLVFKNYTDTLLAKMRVHIEFKNSDDEIERSEFYNLEIGKSLIEKYYSSSTLYKEYKYDLPPGDYHLKITLKDEHTELESSQSTKIKIPKIIDSKFNLSSIRFYEKRDDNSPLKAINGYNVNTGFDSLKFNYQITSDENNEEVTIESTLFTFRADSLPAKEMSHRAFRQSSIEHRGIDYVNEIIVESSFRKLFINGTVTIEKNFTQLKQGNYRFQAKITTESGKTYFKVRDFGVKGENYPFIKSTKDLIEPLYYLMRKNEYENALATKSPDSLKRKIDLFWLQEMSNSVKAKRLIELFYRRVEEANLQFSNYKEGWKTDPGMIYILFGPPMYVDQGFGNMKWYYEFDAGLSEPKIVFKDTRYRNKTFPFENYILQRSPDLFNLQYTQIQTWRDGSILKALEF